MTISAKIIADSGSPQGVRITSVQARYPKFIHGELMTHRAFSRNASSSRAIPIARLVQDVIDDPAMPVFWGKNQPGMQAAVELDDLELIYTGANGKPASERKVAREIWLRSRDLAVKQAQALAKLGAHKQIVNRLIEPFCHINVLITATDWGNFFALRRHPDAQPEIHELADAIFDAMAASTPKLLKFGEWHLPFFDPARDVNLLPTRPPDQAHVAWHTWFDNLAIQVSVARCARVSYLTHEGKPPSVEEDLKLYDRLVGSVPLHASPAEHQATPDNVLDGRWVNSKSHGNFTGWIQYRKTLPNEWVPG